MRLLILLILALLSAALAGARASAAPPPDFDADIKPLLARYCFKCHSEEAHKGGLRLDQKASMLRGGDSGSPAIVPGASHKSRIIQAVGAEDAEDAMPPKGDRLKPDEIALLTRWIDTGAHASAAATTLPAAAALEADTTTQVTDQDRQFWSFIPPHPSAPPIVADTAWPRMPIDRFILSRLEMAGLAPTPEASRETLIRRLTYDLTGLPPTPQQVQTFLDDASPDAYSRLVDRLLASPAFGQRLASTWLPLARYAEDQAHQVGNDVKLFYPNAWKYRQWVIDAFNRDLPYDRFILLQLAADKLPDAPAEDQVALGFLGLGPKYYNRGRLEVMADEWEDRVDTVGRTMLGLTVACARCHDHKFDPIPSRDYYALAGVFASTRMVNKVPGAEVKKGEPKKDDAKKDEKKAEEVDPRMLHIVEDAATPQDLNLFIRGNVDRKGPVIPRHFLSILSPSQPVKFSEGSGRKELAQAIASPSNPLTARVIVNRIWGTIFGAYLVPTPSNFGHSGIAPEDAPLLDDLAARFMAQGWSIKTLVRELVLSATYRQSSAAHSANAARDPANQRLWRANRKRLTVEESRDSMLFITGQLDVAGGKSTDLDDPANLRRTVYARISRLKLNDLLMQFDYPDANVHAEKRSVTSTPAQKLFMLNSSFAIARAKALAKRLAADVPSGGEARIRRAYALILSRQPSAREISVALDYLGKSDDAPLTRWERYAQVLMASNEAAYVD